MTKTDMPVRPPLILAWPFVLGLAVQRVWSPVCLPAWGRMVFGLLCTVPAVVLYVAALVAMRRAGTTILPNGRPRVLVVNGPFGISRNPLYLALLLLYAGAAFFLSSLGSLLLLPAVFAWIHFGAVRPEEARLLRLFGEEYARYCSAVPRWLGLRAVTRNAQDHSPRQQA